MAPTYDKKTKIVFYKKNISLATFIIGQPNLPKSLLQQALNLKAIFNVESNFMNNMDYDFCFKNGTPVGTAGVIQSSSSMHFLFSFL